MALIALRNHGLLSHWIVDSTLLCMAVVGTHAEAEVDADAEPQVVVEGPDDSSHKQKTVGQSIGLGPYRAVRIMESGIEGDSLEKSRLVDACGPYRSDRESYGRELSRKRNIGEVTYDAESELPKKILRTVIPTMEFTTTHRNESVKVLLDLYDLCEVLDVEDDLLSIEKSTQTVFKRRYMHFLCSLSSLAPSIRTRNSDLDVQAFRNRSNQWEGDDIHFSYTRDIGCCREGPFDPHRDRKIGPSGRIGDDQHVSNYTSMNSALTTHVLKVSAISSSEIFHLDFDPKSIRRKQLMGLYG